MSGQDEPILVPYAPLNIPKAVAPDVWIVDGGEIRFSYFGFNLPFPTRMTIVRLPSGGLWLHSPTVPDEALFGKINEIGPIRFLIAPNTLHYWWIADWKEKFPAALVYTVPGLQRSARRRIPIERTLEAAPPPEWADAIDQVMIRGDMLTEVEFFHRSSRTLILTDLIENFELSRIRKRFYRWLMRIGGVADPDGKAPYDMQLSFFRHRNGVRTAVRRMIAWKPERIIIAHGRWYDVDAGFELNRAFRWIL
ncbi:MAG TPA: DUF4336 domain-containing protein [Xanthobacteraceae bacterium]